MFAVFSNYSLYGRLAHIAPHVETFGSCLPQKCNQRGWKIKSKKKPGSGLVKLETPEISKGVHKTGNIQTSSLNYKKPFVACTKKVSLWASSVSFIFFGSQPDAGILAHFASCRDYENFECALLLSIYLIILSITSKSTLPNCKNTLKFVLLYRTCE